MKSRVARRFSGPLVAVVLMLVLSGCGGPSSVFGKVDARAGRGNIAVHVGTALGLTRGTWERQAQLLRGVLLGRARAV